MNKKASRFLAFVLCVLMIISIMPMMALADYNANYKSTTHTVFKHTEQTLAPGVTQYTNYAYTTADNKQMVYYVTTADVNRDDVIMQVSYKGMQHDTLGMEKLAETVKTANAKYSNPEDPDFISEYYTVVSATNGNGYNMQTGKPTGVWAMGGDIITDYTGGSCYLAIDGNGKAVMGKTVDEWNALKAGAGVQEAINCFGSILIWDGAIQITQTSSYYSDRASRTMVGVTEDGKVVCAVVDGRQEPFSCGASMLELANIMLEAGCKYAMNLDGGGSTTFMAKNEGSNECTVNNRPSDGSERSISNGIIIASLAAPSNVFDHATISLSNNYVMPNASVDVVASGVSPAGTAAEIPENITYTAELGTVTNGVYTAGSTTGVDTIKMMYNDNVVGSCKVNIVAPTKISFAAASVACPYGKTTDLTVVPTYGEFDLEVAYDANSVSFLLGDDTFGTVENGKFTATTEALSATTSTITVKTNCAPSVEATVPLQVGRGSEIIWDFEDQDVSKWSYFDYYNSKCSLDISTVDKTTGKVHNGDYALALHYDYSQTTYYEDYLSLIVEYNAADIKAHGAKNLDPDGAQIGGNLSDYIDITGACGMGFWMYIPDDIDIRGFNPRLMFGFKKAPTDKWTRGTTSMKLIVDVQHLPTDGWYYYWADLSAYSSYAGLTVQNSRPLDENGSSKNGHGGYAGGSYYAGSILDFYVEDSAWKSYKEKSYNGNFTLYIDDWTVDYSTVVEDKQAPEFGAAVYACNGMFDAADFKDGTTITANEIDFTIEVADANRFLPAGSTDYKKTTNAVGIDASTAKIYIDGVEVASTYKNGKLAVDKALTLADGTHKVTFEIADNNGNVAKKIYSFNVAAGTAYDTIKVVPHDTALTETLAGSLYYIDLVATDIANVNKVTTTLKVNNVNNWEPNGIVTADGFTATWTTEPGDAGEIYLTITRTGEVTATGEAVLASIPIRAWYPHNALNKDSAWLIANNRIFPMDIQLITKAGAVEFIGETEYLGAFSANEIQIDNEAMCAYGYIGVIKGKENSGSGYKTSLHTHSATDIEDKAPTCTAAGYTGRTYCDVCDSVVDWGTIVPATGHNYVNGVCAVCGAKLTGEFGGVYYIDGVKAQGWIGDSYYSDGIKFTGIQMIDGVFYDFGDDGVCANHEKYTGIYNDGENLYYIVLGEYSTGWRQIDSKDYYFDAASHAALKGVQHVSSHEYTFDENGVLVKGSWADRNGGKTYYWAGQRYHDGMYEIEGKTYLFDRDDCIVTGFARVETAVCSGVFIPRMFGEDGAMIENGLATVKGDTVFCKDGEAIYAGLVQDADGNYYYINSYCKAVKDCTYSIGAAKTNGLLPAGTYEFGADGKMVMPEPPEEPEEPEVKNGLVFDEDGEVRYYDNGTAIYAGLVQDADGNYYYVNSYRKAVKDCTYSIGAAKTNGLLPAGTYEFGADGKMVMPEPPEDPEEPEVKNGLVFDEDGEVRYYNNGEAIYAGLVQDADGNYYYVNSYRKAVKDCTYSIGAAKTNGLLPAGTYEFGADGKMVMPEAPEEPEVKNGLVFDEDGEVRYYDNGEAIYAGLVQDADGNYYYVNSYRKAVKDCTYSIGAAKTNGLLPGGVYRFGADGKMIIA